MTAFCSFQKELPKAEPVRLESQFRKAKLLGTKGQWAVVQFSPLPSEIWNWKTQQSGVKTNMVPQKTDLWR